MDNEIVHPSDILLSTDPSEEIFHLDQEIIKAINSSDDIKQLNLPASEEFVSNKKQQKISVRTFFPTSKEPSLIVIFIHGYSTHSNTPWIPLIAKEFVNSNIAFVSFDLHGHGYRYNNCYFNN